MPMDPEIYIIAGPNGAGKSTLAPYLLKDRLHLKSYVNADLIALGLSAYSPETVALEAGRIMLRRLDELGKQHQSFGFARV
jgi:predicted ABC-type ATPase